LWLRKKKKKNQFIVVDGQIENSRKQENKSKIKIIREATIERSINKKK